MTPQDDVELGQIGTLGIVCVLIAFLLVLLSGCAHPPKSPPPPPPLGDICRDSCASRGAIAAAVIGPVDPKLPPKCACGMKDEGA